MYGGQARIALALYVMAVVWLAAKNLTWEETKLHKARGVVSFLVVLFSSIVIVVCIGWINFTIPSGLLTHETPLRYNFIAPTFPPDFSKLAVPLAAETAPQKTIRSDLVSRETDDHSANMHESARRTLPAQKEIKPEVALRFVYPDKPALVIVNLSDSVVRDIKWIVVLWNMDLPDRNDPLPLPVNTFDFIRGKQEGGPQALFTPAVSPLVKDGDRLFGSAAVDCPECGRGRTYVVYVVYGKGGWYSEVLKEESGRAYLPKSFDKSGRTEYFKALEEAVPEQYRTPIS